MPISQTFVDVVVPTFNRAHTIERAINSVMQQSYNKWTLTLVDDGSSDRTEEIVYKTMSKNPDANIQYLKTQNQGVSAARNHGIQQGNSSWIALLDSDDEWLPDRLNLQMKLLQDQPSLRLVHGEEIWLRNGQAINQKKKHTKSGGYIFDRCLSLCCISPSASLIRRDVFAEIGLFREDFPVCEDYDFWLRCCSRYPVGFVSKPIIKKHGGHSDQLSQKFKAMDYWRVKSMSLLKQENNLTVEQLNQLNAELEKKKAILTKGYLKYGHQDKIEELALM